MRERNPGPQSSSLAGSLLLAHPTLRDLNFRRTVVLMTADASEGAMGVVLNRPLNKCLGDVDSAFALGPLAGISLYHGGPVQTEQLILAAWQAQSNGFHLHLGIEPARAENFLSVEGIHVRAFFGYAGWSEGQLKNELKHNTWLVEEPPTDLFDQPGDLSLWQNVLGRRGAQWRLLAGEPDDPEHN